MSQRLSDREIDNIFIESEDEDVIEDIDDLVLHWNSSSDEETDSEDEQQSTSAKRSRKEERKWEDGDFSPQIHPFNNSSSGIQQGYQMETELDYFKLFFNTDVMNIIVRETNRYASQIRVHISAKSKLQKWTDTNISEMYVFLATLMLTSLIGKNSMKDYWSTNPIIATPYFRVLFSQDRFFLLLRTLHFADNTSRSTDRLYKIRALLDPIKNIYKTVFYPFRNICIDESLLLWKGRLSFRIYIPSKRNRFGIKMFVCCDVETGYVLDIIVYAGSQTDIENDSNIGMSGSVVKTMMQDYLGKGHRLYIDNWYTSIPLFDYLFENRTHACGTIRTNRKGFAKFPAGKQKRGYVKFLHSQSLLAIKWMDKREVHMLTNIHESNMVVSDAINYVTGEKIIKPEAIVDYNLNMGAVDKSDMMISFLDCSRKSMKWYKKIFFRLLDVSTLNSYNLYQVNTGKKPKFSDFRLELITQLIQEYHKARPSSGGRKSKDTPVRLTARHFPHPVPQTMAQGSKTQRKCYVCSHSKNRQKRRKDTRFMCVACDVALCVYPCFEEYHTKKKF